MSEIDEAAKIITSNVDPGAKIIFGAYNDRKLKPGQLKVIVVAAGFSGLPTKTEVESLSLFPVDNKHPKGSSQGKQDKPQDKSPKPDSKSDAKADKSQDKGEEKEPQGDDIWDIPAFLRKRRK